MESQPNSAQPIACSLTSAELRLRKATVIAALKQEVLQRTELPDGYAYTFSSSEGSIDRLAEFIKTEKACCGFFTFRLTVEGATARLELRGPAGAKEFIEGEIGL